MIMETHFYCLLLYFLAKQFSIFLNQQISFILHLFFKWSSNYFMFSFSLPASGYSILRRWLLCLLPASIFWQAEAATQWSLCVPWVRLCMPSFSAHNLCRGLSCNQEVAVHYRVSAHFSSPVLVFSNHCFALNEETTSFLSAFALSYGWIIPCHQLGNALNEKFCG